MFYDAQIPSEGPYAVLAESCAANDMSGPVRSNAISYDRSVPDTSTNSRKRKHAEMSEMQSQSVHNRCARTSHGANNISQKRARRLLHHYIHKIHVQLPIVALDHMMPTFDQFLNEIDRERSSVSTSSTLGSLQRSHLPGMKQKYITCRTRSLTTSLQLQITQCTERCFASF